MADDLPPQVYKFLQWISEGEAYEDDGGWYRSRTGTCGATKWPAEYDRCLVICQDAGLVNVDYWSDKFEVRVTYQGGVVLAKWELATAASARNSAIPAEESNGSGEGKTGNVTAPDSVPLHENQKRILDALERRVLRQKEIAELFAPDRGGVPMGSRQLKRDYLGPLMDAGRVKHHKKAGGYYRPDAPPPAWTIPPDTK